MAECRPPKKSVRSYWRRKARTKPKAAAITARYPWTVVDSRTGRVVSRHAKFTTAVNARKRLDLAAYRRGRGRPYNVVKDA